jgi:hypothetical protein
LHYYPRATIKLYKAQVKRMLNIQPICKKRVTIGNSILTKESCGKHLKGCRHLKVQE